METLTDNPVSGACLAHMHPCCQFPETCGCTVCHHTCENPDCARACMKLYELPGGMQVCAYCYKQMAPPVGRTTACEACGHPAAYLHPKHGDDRYLCASCHVEAGHVRLQDRGE